MGIIILLSAIIVYFLGMPRAEESNDLVNKFKIPEKKNINIWRITYDEFRHTWYYH